MRKRRISAADALNQENKSHAVSGKVALVTRPSGGIVPAIVNKLRDQDVIVISTDRENANICGDMIDQTFCDTLPAEII